MPKKNGIPKSILADINKLKTRIASLEKSNASLTKELKANMKSAGDWMKKQEQTIAQMGKKSAKREKRKPSAYNLFLKDKKGALFLVTALEDAVIELKSLHRRLAASGRFSFGPADLMRATLGIEPGAVTPFAAMNDSERRVSVVLDAALMRHETLNCHPLVNTMTTSIAGADLVRFLEATGHPPRIVAL